MINNQDDLIARFNEYQLMVEEVLGGMDMMIARLEERLTVLEGNVTMNNAMLKRQHSESVQHIHTEIQTLRAELSHRSSIMLSGPARG